MQTPVTKQTTINLSLSDNIYKPLTISPTNSLLIDLGLSFNSSTMPKPEVEVLKLINMGTWISLPEHTEDIIVEPVEGFLSAIRISTTSKANFDEGECYEVRVNQSGKDAMICYFAVNYTLDATNLSMAALSDDCKMVVCISDIHLGQDDLYAECKENRKPLTEFLTKLSCSPNIKELVIAGDLVDEWVIPGSIDAHGNPLDKDIPFVEKVKNNNGNVFAALDILSKKEGVTVTYVPGNHDLLIDKEQLQKVLPNIQQARDCEGIQNGLGLGSYSPVDFPEAIIEHGHRYNFFCAPCLKPDKDPNAQSILPPGYFFTRIATEAFCNRPAGKNIIPETEMQYGDEDTFMFSQYSESWKTCLESLPVRYKNEDKFIKTNIGGFIGEYSLDDVMPHLENGTLVSTLYKTISNKENWAKRQTENQVPIPIPVMDALLQADNGAGTDSMSNTQYFSNEKLDKSIVVFGHSHEPRMLTYPTHNKKTGIYANTGTWIDVNNKGMSTMTFVVLIPCKTEKSVPIFVNLYQYFPDGTVVLMDSQATVRY